MQPESFHMMISWRKVIDGQSASEGTLTGLDGSDMDFSDS